MERIGRYQILGELGRGAMGIVYKAQDPAIGRLIAVKTIRLLDLTDEAERQRLRERLFREAQSAGILSHPGIVTIYDVAEEDGLAYVFMEFVNGPPLEKMLRHEQTPDKETLLSIFRQTAAALDYAHRKGIVHRDIKPANIMIHEDGTAKITDFGVAKIASQTMTLSGTMMGTPSYMPPEQVQGTPVTGRADQFSLAVIVYEVLTGDKPFAAEYLPSLLYKIVREDPLPPQRLNPTLGSQVEPVLRKALAKNPDERYESCTDFVNALSSALSGAKGWTPLPRGVSQNMPTISSQDWMEETTDDRTLASTAVPIAPVSKPAAPATPPPVPIPIRPAGPANVGGLSIEPPARRLEPVESSHVMRNLIVSAVAVALVLATAFLIIRKLTPESKPPVVATQPADQTPPAPEPVAPQTEAPKPAESQKPPEPQKPVESSEPPKETAPQVDTKPEPKPEPSEPAHAKPVPVNPVPAEGTFQLTTSPPGAEAVFDYREKCTTPCTMTLAAGRHTFVIRKAGYRDAPKIIEIPRDTGLIVDLQHATGMLMLTSQPAGCSISVDGQEQQQKTPASLTLIAGIHKIQVRQGDFKQDFTVDVRDGAILTRNVELTSK